MFVKAKAVHGIVGDYCAWHEIYDRTEYIFGEHLYAYESYYEYLMNKLGLPQGFEQDKEKMDEVILDYYKDYESFDGSGWDYEIQDCLLEIENNIIIKVWY